ncbi:MAG: TMEM165/GDT1 family protein [Jaaginema sp. PMC 1079.18]|nr:TMEM165/GDT1 family protein [Jaaginema sp. PMC 1080.18]MEC4853308.1 TMEM165/GDT1 family protein [Jaaginema sp. PMC 1079.18]MEC4865487.1 TMEM165/GDT1 family protein [Jaaginema sp. PMC 1078.18]
MTSTKPQSAFSSNENNPAQTPTVNAISLSFSATFSSTFIAILLAEMGDKTQLATLLMSAESHAPWTVFTGAAIALLTTSLIGVSLGYWLSKRVSPRTMNLAAATMLLSVSVLLLWDVVQG